MIQLIAIFKNFTLKLSYIFLFFCFASATSVEGEYSIAFVHIGHTIPDCAFVACAQARLFNKTCPIYFLANREALKKVEQELQKSNVIGVSLESLPRTRVHAIFDQTTKLNAIAFEGLSRLATERFFYLDEFMEKYKISNLFHLEYDNMLYVNLEELLPIFEKYYPGIAATWMSEIRVCPGFIYFHTWSSIHKFTHFIAEEAPKHLSDMETPVIFRNKYGPTAIDSLPVLLPEYAQLYPMRTMHGRVVQDREILFNHLSKFNSLFDGAAFGVFIGGLSPRNGSLPAGYIEEDSAFQVNHFTITWELDSEGRKIPYATLAGKKYRLNNLHIHSKKLHDFTS